MASVANNNTTVGPNPAAPGMSTSYANVTGEPSRKALNFRTLFTPAGNMIYMVVPVESIRAISERFSNMAYGFFLEKRVAYLVVANYVKNTWGKYGLVKAMLNSSTDTFSFQFSSMDGLDAMLENGPWFISNNPLILKKWNLDDDLSSIATNLGTPLMLDSYTFDMCIQSWGRSSYAKALIEIQADVELKYNIVVAISKLFEEGFYTCNIRVDSTSTTSIVEKIDKMKRLIIDGKLTLVDDEGKPLKKVDSLGDHDSEAEFA
ncbi:putative reverse transcriptase domain-containing protein [Tanacetum coccineum]